MTLKHTLMSTALTGAMLVAAYPAAAQSSVSRQMDSLQSQIQQLQQQLQTLQGQVNDSAAAARQAQQDAAQAQAQAKQAQAHPSGGNAVVTMSSGDRPGICTADGENCISLTSRLHFDVGDYLSVRPQGTTPVNMHSGVNARRARIGILGKFAGDWNYALIYDFGGSTDATPSTGLENAFVSYNGLKPLAITLGYIDVPFTLDEAVSSNDIMFMERASIQSVVTSISGSDARSAFGLAWNNDRAWVGAFLTGPTAGSSHTQPEQLGSTFRASYQLVQTPGATLHIGADGEYQFEGQNEQLTLSDRPELRISPTTFLNTGTLNSKSAYAVGPELAGSWGSLYGQAEYYHIGIDRTGTSPTVNFDGYYAQAAYTLTGEERHYMPATGAYGSITPAHPLSLSHGGAGAWEVAARYSYANLNDKDVFGGKQHVYTLGLNWYPVTNIRFMFNYLHGMVDKANASGVHFDAIAMRTQIAF
jgi:phosphate-selective porin OprO and OprP